MAAGLALTRALILQHGAQRQDAYDAALLDVAQDHLLETLARAGFFDDGRLTFKGGTSLRKCRLGQLGRFSTDLDFAAPDEDKVVEVCDAIDGATVSGFTYRLTKPSKDARHWEMVVTHPTLGSPAVQSSVEFARRPLCLPADQLGFIPIRIHDAYPFALPRIPVIAEAEACAEKLARLPPHRPRSRRVRPGPVRAVDDGRAARAAPLGPQGVGRRRRRRPGHQAPQPLPGTHVQA